MHPLKARAVQSPKRAAVVLAGLWILAFLLLLPQVFIQRLEPLLQLQPHVTEQPIRMAFVCVEYFAHHGLNIAYTFFFYAVLYLGPVVTMSVTYGIIARKLWTGRRIGETPEDGKRIREKKRIIKMLVIIVVMFGFSWLPFFTWHLLQLWLPRQNRRVLTAFLQLLGYSNSCINPFIYCFMNDKFKKAVIAFLCRRGARTISSRSRSSRRSSQYTYTDSSNHTTHSTLMENRSLVGSPTRKTSFL